MAVARCFAVLASFAFLTLTMSESRAAAEELCVLSGTITVDDKPLPSGRILFHLDEDQFVGAKIKADGTYKVSRVPPGRHKISVEFPGVPARYAERTALEVEVSGSKLTVDLHLKSK